MTSEQKTTIKKIWNITFYVILTLLTLYFLKRKFIVPTLDTESISLQTYQNEDINLADYKGKVVVINFWQTWCGPCIGEMKHLDDMTNQWGDIAVLAVSDEPLSKTKSFTEKYQNINFVSINSMSEANISQFPTTYILNKKGVKVYSKIGAKNWADKNFISTLKKNWDAE